MGGHYGGRCFGSGPDHETVLREHSERTGRSGNRRWRKPSCDSFEGIYATGEAAILSVTILGFQGAWNDFFWPLVVINSPADAFTLPVGLLSLRNAYGVAGDWNLILAGAFLSTIPVLIVFMVFQRYFVGNDISSAVKG